MVTTKFTFGRY